MTWTPPVLLPQPGHEWRGDELEAVLDQIASLTDPGWSTYVPVWTAAGTAPALGNAVINVAEYRRPPGSDLAHVLLKITFGSSSTYGTSAWFWNLPVQAHANQADLPAFGSAWYLDAGVKEGAGLIRIESSGLTFRIASAPSVAGTNDNWGSTVPFTWGSGDVFKVAFAYRAA